MSDWAAYKPLLSALVLPPVPWLVLVLVGARLILPRRGLGYAVLLMGVGLLWLDSTPGWAVFLQDRLLAPPPPVLGATQERLAQQGRDFAQRQEAARRQRRSAPAPQVGLVVLGAGIEPRADEYGLADLAHFSAQRLRYGVWLSRQTGWPLGFSGGVGWAQKQADVGPSEAEVAARVARDLYGLSLRWTEGESADTRGNAAHTVALLGAQGVREIVLVTSAWHMPRARRAFEQAAARWAARQGVPAPTITPAPTGYWRLDGAGVLNWLPSASGALQVRLAYRELLGLWTGN